MPELPEVETIRLKLKPLVIGKKIKEINILVPKQFIGQKGLIINKTITDIQRSGKLFNIVFNNQQFLNIHLKLTGQLLFAKNINHPVYKNEIPLAKSKIMPGRTTRIIIYFSDGSGLFFNDLRKFGWMKISNIPERPQGIDVLSPNFTFQYFTSLTNSTNKSIKLLLMDQEKIAGIGNIYANDSLFLAKIHPQRPAKTLTAKEINNLYLGIKKIINQGIKDQGSSGADEAFILPDGKKGNHQKHFLVYQKEDQPCPNCKALIKRLKQGGRSSFYCPKCQNL